MNICTCTKQYHIVGKLDIRIDSSTNMCVCRLTIVLTFIVTGVTYGWGYRSGGIAERYPLRISPPLRVGVSWGYRFYLS